MVFSKLFGKQDKGQPAPEDPPAHEIAEEEASPDTSGEVEAEDSWIARARRVLPQGASTGSKRVESMYGVDDGVPTHFVKAVGCRVVTAEGETLIDCTMALGSVALGYAEPDVTRAAMQAIASGSVSGLSPTLEVEVAERFCGVIPCAERVQFLKTGADAVSAAVRIARTYTNRDVVIGSGYFGWHDWWSDKPGVPKGTKQSYRPVPFDDIPALERAVSEAGSSLAAIVLEPVVERLASKEWMERARALCDKAGAVLVFDEIKTGFRLATGGYQQYAEIVPDLAAFGKAMANGHPIAAVCGRKELMDACDRTWISSTLASETGALAAAGAVLAWHEAADICQTLWQNGADMRASMSDAIAACGFPGVTVEGIDPMWFLKFENTAVETEFLLAAARNGVLFKRGPYNFPAIAHDEEALREIEAAASAAFVELTEADGE